MFEVGFSELLVIFVRRTGGAGPHAPAGPGSKIGRWVGKARTMARQFREQLENEINLEELNQHDGRCRRRGPRRHPPPPPGVQRRAAARGSQHHAARRIRLTRRCLDPNEDTYLACARRPMRLPMAGCVRRRIPTRRSRLSTPTDA